MISKKSDFQWERIQIQSTQLFDSPRQCLPTKSLPIEDLNRVIVICAYYLHTTTHIPLLNGHWTRIMVIWNFEKSEAVDIFIEEFKSL